MEPWIAAAKRSETLDLGFDVKLRPFCSGVNQLQTLQPDRISTLLCSSFFLICTFHLSRSSCDFWTTPSRVATQRYPVSEIPDVLISVPLRLRLAVIDV
jgi:hypothetical protein